MLLYASCMKLKTIPLILKTLSWSPDGQDRQRSGRGVVEGAHMELASPTIADAIRKCADAGAKSIIIAPYFLSRYDGLALTRPYISGNAVH